MLNAFLYSAFYWKFILLVALAVFLTRLFLSTTGSNAFFYDDLLASVIVTYIYYWINQIDKSDLEFGGFYFIKGDAFLKILFISALINCGVFSAASTHILLIDQDANLEAILVILFSTLLSFFIFRSIRNRIKSKRDSLS